MELRTRHLGLLTTVLLVGCGIGRPVGRTTDSGGPTTTDSGPSTTDTGTTDAGPSDSGVITSGPPEVCDGVDNDGDGVVDLPGCHPDLVAWYPFQDSGPNPWSIWDVSDNAHHGWLESPKSEGGGAFFYDPGAGTGRALCLATDIAFPEWGVVPTAPTLTPQSGLTLEYWSIESFTTVPYGIAKYDVGGNDRSYALSLRNFGLGAVEVTLWLSESGTAGDLVASAPCPGCLSENHHFAATFDPSSGEARLFIDGIEVGATVQGTVGSLHSGSSDLLINAQPGTWNTFHGREGCIDEVKIWRVVRTEAEICADAGGAYDPVGPSCSLPAL